MLITSIPKSMGTSLHIYLTTKHRLEELSHYSLKKFPKPKGWRYFHNFSHGGRDIPKKVAKDICDNRKFLLLQHIPPSEHNIKVFSKYKKVVLLREPEEVIASWRRTAIMNNRPLRGVGLNLFYNKKLLKQDEAKWIRIATKRNLLKELYKFIEGWKRHQENTLYISYYDLLNNPKDTVNKVEDFFNLPLSEEVELPKRRYTRG